MQTAKEGVRIENWSPAEQMVHLESVRTINDRLMPLHEALFVEPSPGPVKYATSLLGKCKNIVRLPMVPVSAQTETRVREAMVHAGLLN